MGLTVLPHAVVSSFGGRWPGVSALGRCVHGSSSGAVLRTTLKSSIAFCAYISLGLNSWWTHLPETVCSDLEYLGSDQVRVPILRVCIIDVYIVYRFKYVDLHEDTLD